MSSFKEPAVSFGLDILAYVFIYLLPKKEINHQYLCFTLMIHQMVLVIFCPY